MGERIRQLRVQAGIPQHILASAAGMSVEQLTLIENGERQCSSRAERVIIAAVCRLRWS
jgi:transcriptional regulator with XRE-family HTH domain